MSNVRIRVKQDGPLVVEGDVTIVDADGTVYATGSRMQLALCRCGGSRRKPLCDGTHAKTGFRAGASPARAAQPLEELYAVDALAHWEDEGGPSAVPAAQATEAGPPTHGVDEPQPADWSVLFP